jgi:hypothetical protein
VRIVRAVRRRTCARAWLAALVAAVIGCAIPVAQARAASCKRAAALVSGAMASERPQSVETVDAARQAGAPLDAQVSAQPCPSVVAIVIAPPPIAPASCGHVATVKRADRAPPSSVDNGLERPPRHA